MTDGNDKPRANSGKLRLVRRPGVAAGRRERPKLDKFYPADTMAVETALAHVQDDLKLYVESCRKEAAEARASGDATFAQSSDERAARYESVASLEFGRAARALVLVIQRAQRSGDASHVLWMHERYKDRLLTEWLAVCRTMGPGRETKGQVDEFLARQGPDAVIEGMLSRYWDYASHQLPKMLAEIDERAETLKPEQVREALVRYADPSVRTSKVASVAASTDEGFAGALAAMCGAFGYSDQHKAHGAFSAAAKRERERLSKE